MNLGLFTYKMGLKNHPHLAGPLWLKRAAALSGPGTASGPGRGSENESRFHTTGDRVQGDAAGVGQAGLQKPGGKGPYVPHRGARAAVERGALFPKQKRQQQKC